MEQHSSAAKLIPDGGLAALSALRPAQPAAHASSTSRRRNELRLQRLIDNDYRVLGVMPPFVGRREELEDLYNVVRKSTTESSYQQVTLTGSRGLGKTRLVAEVLAILDPKTRGIGVLAVSCADTDRGSEQTVPAQLIHRLFGVSASDSNAAARERIIDGLSTNVAEAELGITVRDFALLAGLPGPNTVLTGDPRRARDNAEDALIRFLEQRCRQTPHVLVVHDCDELDPRTSSFLAKLARGLAATPTVCILIGRTEPTVARASDVVVRLEPLNDDAILRFASTLLEPAGDRAQLLSEKLVAAAAGNPRLVEENIRLLSQQGALTVSGDQWSFTSERLSPFATSLSEAAELRRELLSNDDRRVLECAAIFGRTFWLEGVASILRGELAIGRDDLPWVDEISLQTLSSQVEHLRAAGFVAVRSDSRIHGARELGFTNMSDHDAFYREVTPGARTRRHRLAAQWLNGAARRDPARWSEEIASHWARGGRNADAAVAYERAARHAATGFALSDAQWLFRQAVAYIDVDHAPILMRCLEGWTEAAMSAGAFILARTLAGAALDATRLSNEVGKGASAWLQLGVAHRALGNYASARECLEYAASLFRLTNNNRGASTTLDELGRVVWLQGGSGAYAEARRSIVAALDARRLDARPGPIADSLSNLANILLQMGEREDARAAFSESMVLRRQIHDLAGEARCHLGLGAIAYADDKPEDALASWQEGLALAQTAGDRDLAGAFYNNIGEVAVAVRRYDEARAALESARQVTAQTGDQRTAADVFRNLAGLALAEDDLDAAQRFVGTAIEMGTQIGSKIVMGQAQRMHGRLLSTLAATGDPTASDRAVSAFNAAIANFEAAGDQLERLRTEEALAEHLGSSKPS